MYLINNYNIFCINFWKTYFPNYLYILYKIFSFFDIVFFLYQPLSNIFNLSITSHSPIIVALNSPLSTTTMSAKLHNQSTNWVQFRCLVELNLPIQIPLKSSSDIEEEILNKVIQNAVWSSTQIFEPKYPTFHTDENIKAQIKVKRRLRKRWQETRMM